MIYVADNLITLKKNEVIGHVLRPDCLFGEDLLEVVGVLIYSLAYCMTCGLLHIG